MSTQASAMAAEVVRFTAAAFAQMRQEAQRERQEECCGVLLRGGEAVIERIVPLPNEARDRRNTYAISPRKLFELERTAQVAGFYHSHPDGTSSPSHRDLELAWPGYVYVIAGSVVQAWRLNAAGTHFHEVSLVVEP